MLTASRARYVVRLHRVRDPGIYNVVDDDPAPQPEWLPVLARALRADPPR